MKSLKSEARVLPWRRRGGYSPALAATPPRFLLLFRHPVGSSPIGQFKPPREPLGFRHLGPAPGVTEMPRPPEAPPSSGPRVASPWRRATPLTGLARACLSRACLAVHDLAFPPTPFLPCLQPSSVPLTQRKAQLLAYSL